MACCPSCGWTHPLSPLQLSWPGPLQQGPKLYSLEKDGFPQEEKTGPEIIPEA